MLLKVTQGAGTRVCQIQYFELSEVYVQQTWPNSKCFTLEEIFLCFPTSYNWCTNHTLFQIKGTQAKCWEWRFMQPKLPIQRGFRQSWPNTLTCGGSVFWFDFYSEHFVSWPNYITESHIESRSTITQILFVYLWLRKQGAPIPFSHLWAAIAIPLWQVCGQAVTHVFLHLLGARVWQIIAFSGQGLEHHRNKHSDLKFRSSIWENHPEERSDLSWEKVPQTQTSLIKCTQHPIVPEKKSKDRAWQPNKQSLCLVATLAWLPQIVNCTLSDSSCLSAIVLVFLSWFEKRCLSGTWKHNKTSFPVFKCLCRWFCPSLVWLSASHWPWIHKKDWTAAVHWNISSDKAITPATHTKEGCAFICSPLHTKLSIVWNSKNLTVLMTEVTLQQGCILRFWIFPLIQGQQVSGWKKDWW